MWWLPYAVAFHVQITSGLVAMCYVMVCVAEGTRTGVTAGLQLALWRVAL